jgi:DNA-binding protein Fis
VRELRSAVIGIRVRHPKDRLDASHLAELTGRNPLRCGRDLTLETLIRRHIGEVLRLAGNNFSAAAKELGVPRSTLRNMLKRYGIKHLTLIGRR